MKTIVLFTFLLVSLVSKAQMLNDRFSNVKVDFPKFKKGKGPSILIDAAHHNFIVEMGLIKPLLDLSISDGYRPKIDSLIFTKQYVNQYKIIIIMPAMPFKFGSKKNVNDEITFTDDELNVLHDWVLEGGSLLMFSEHAPIDKSVTPLFNKFGIQVTIGIVADSLNCDMTTNLASFKTLLKFTSKNGLLNREHPIISGTRSSERVNNIVTYGGSGLVGKGYTNILNLSPTAFIMKYNGNPPTGFANSQCLAGKIGKGKVVALGDCNGFTAMYINNAEKKFSLGMQVTEYDWRQFVLNTLHWL